MIPTIVSFFTPTYAIEAGHLRDSCLSLGLDCDIRAVADAGRWERNCGQKPGFIRDRLEENARRGVVWIDADAVVRRRPKLLEDLHCDFAAHWRHGKELMSGTMYFAPTAEAIDLLEVWREAQAENPDEWDQTVLQRLIESGGWWMAGLRMTPLPAEYTAVDTMDLDPKAIVIEHGQASRRLKTPKVSVLMPTYNQAEFISDAIDSIQSQKFTDFELIVCDDGSTDQTSQILKDAGVQAVSHGHNLGASMAINSAASASTGQYITWVSSDNVMYQGWLGKLVQYLEGHPEAGAVYSAYCRVQDGRRIDQYPGEYDPCRLESSENCYFGPAFLVRREVWQDHRGGSSHDYDNWARIEEACWARGMTIGYIPEVLCDYYVGDWNTAKVRPDLYDAAKWRAAALRRRATLELAR